MMHCDECGQKRDLLSLYDYDYTKETGLDPALHQVTLSGIRGYACGCGIAPVIPNMEGLHFTIGLMLIREDSPLEGTAIRFMRKTLGMTQKEFAREIEVHEQTVSKWERNDPIPDRPLRVYAATVFLSHLYKREEVIRSMSMEFVSETIDLLVSRNSRRMHARARIGVDLSSAPPAWMIQEIHRGNGSSSPGRRQC